MTTMEIISGQKFLNGSAGTSNPNRFPRPDSEKTTYREPIPTLKISGGQVVNNFPPSPERIEVEPEFYHYYDQSDDYFNSNNYSCEQDSSNAYSWSSYEDTNYQYKEPDENFISIEDLKVKPPLEKPQGNEEEKRGEPETIQIEIEDDEDDEEDDDVILVEDDDVGIDENEVGIELDWMDLEQGEGGKQQSYECFLCNRKVASNYNLRRHMMIHTGERPFGCDICFKRFREFSDLKKHRRIHSNEQSFKCMVCHRNAPSATNPTKCASCDRSEQRSRSPYSEILGEEVATIEGSQKKAYVCPVCDRIFGSRHNLKRHFMIHTGEKPYKCDTCDKSFREVSTLKKHMLTHSRIKLFNCAVCGKDFNDFNSYTRHKTTHGDLSLLNEHSLSKMYNTTNDESSSMQFECSECQKTFTNSANYKEHLKQHASEFAFQCYICKRMFRTKEKLSSHFITHNYDEDNDDVVVEECEQL